MMETIEIYINRFIRYMSKLGLEKWQLQIIFVILITLLILIVLRKWRRRARLIHPVQDGKDPGIIGKRLYSRDANQTEVKDTKGHHKVSVPAKSVKEEKPDHRQSANVWEKAEEQISQLKDEITKHKQTEENLRQIIDELEKSNSQILNGSTESRNTEHYIREESLISKNIDLQLSEVDQNEQADNGSNESGQLHTNNQDRIDTAEEKRIETDTEQQNPELITNTEQTRQKTIHVHNQEAESIREDQKDRENSQQPGAPLDAKELKAIAELAKRLGGNNQRQ